MFSLLRSDTIDYIVAICLWVVDLEPASHLKSTYVALYDKLLGYIGLQCMQNVLGAASGGASPYAWPRVYNRQGNLPRKIKSAQKLTGT